MTLSTLITPDEITRLEQQVADGTSTPQTRYELARAYVEKEQWENAEPHYLAILATAASEFPYVYKELGHLYLRVNRPVEAQQAFARYLQVATTSEEKRVTLQLLATLVGEEPIICEGCGRKSPIADAFRMMEMEGTEKIVCPRCRLNLYRNDKIIEPTNSFLGWALIGGLALISYRVAPDIHYYAINILLIFWYYALLIMVHEAAHGIAAFFMGGSIFALDIGQKALLWKFRIGTCVVRIHRLLWGGSASFGFPTIANIRWKSIVATAAPLAVHVMIALLTLPFAWFNGESISSTYLPLQMFWWTNAFMFFINSISRTYWREGKEEKSDGAHLLRLWRREVAEEDLVNDYYQHGLWVALEEEENEKALAWCEKALSRTPDNLYLSLQKGYILMDMGRHAEGQHLLTSLLTHSDLTQENKGIVANNLAWSLLTHGEPESALPHARTAHHYLPWRLPVMEGLGASLVENQQPSEGLPVLQQVQRIEPLSSTYAYMAWAYAQLGNSEESSRSWKHALALDPHNEHLAHIRPKLESMGY